MERATKRLEIAYHDGQHGRLSLGESIVKLELEKWDERSPSLASNWKISKDHSYFFLKQPCQSHGVTLPGTPRRADSSVARLGRILSQLTTTIATIGSLESLGTSGNPQRDSFTIYHHYHHHHHTPSFIPGERGQWIEDLSTHGSASIPRYGQVCGLGSLSGTPFLQGNHRVVILTVPTAGS